MVLIVLSQIINYNHQFQQELIRLSDSELFTASKYPKYGCVGSMWAPGL